MNPDDFIIYFCRIGDRKRDYALFVCNRCEVMNRKITVAAAQLSGIPDEFTKGIQAKEINNLMIRGNQKERREAEEILAKVKIDDIRKYSISRMIGLMQEASEQGCDVVVFPELALTSFFPYFYIEAEQILLRFFEREPIQCGIAKPLFDYAQRRGMSFSFGYAEYVSSSCSQHSQRYNTYILVDKKGSIYKYRKTHIPGFEKPRPDEETFQFEKSQFVSSQGGYPVFDSRLTQRGSEPVDVRVGMLICHDRRYNAPFLIMGMQKVEIILNGYNTPFSLPFAKDLDKNVYTFHYLPLQAQAITEGTFIISTARAGNVFGIDQIAGTCIINPNGDFLSKTESLAEKLITAELDLNICESVRAQKYGGDRLEPQVVLAELHRLTRNS